MHAAQALERRAMTMVGNPRGSSLIFPRRLLKGSLVTNDYESYSAKHHRFHVVS